MDLQHALSVPTKQSDEGGGSGKYARRKSSDSNQSFDVAASLFSSMRAMESSGRSFSSLLTGGLSREEPSLLQAAAHNGRGGIPSFGGNGMGFRERQNSISLPPLMQMGGSLPHRDLDLNSILLQQQRQKIEDNPFHSPPNLGAMRGGYLPSSKLHTSISSSNMNDISTQDLISELTRRQSERSRASAVLNAATSTMFSADQLPPTAGLMNLPQGSLSRDCSLGSLDLVDQYRKLRRRSSASTDSLDLLANTANVDSITKKAITDISTCYAPSKKRGKDVHSEADNSDAGVVHEALKTKRKKATRNPSSSSIDVLLTALGDDLQKLQGKSKEEGGEVDPSKSLREEVDELPRRLSKESLLSNTPESLANNFCNATTHNNIQDNTTLKKNQALATLLNIRPSLPSTSLTTGFEDQLSAAKGANNFDYARRLQMSNSMMASLEYEMLRNGNAMRQIALQDMQRRELASRMVHNNNMLRGQPAVPEQLPKDPTLKLQVSPPLPKKPIPQQKEQQTQDSERLPASGPRNVPMTDCDDAAEDEKGNSKRRITHMKKTTLPLRQKKNVEEPSKIPPQEALMMFLKAHGEKGETLREEMLKAIGETERSLAIIHSWDRSQGLRKCHSRTVVKTRRSRAQIKAFLTGVEPPKEPHRNRKRSKKNKRKRGTDALGPSLKGWQNFGSRTS